MKFDIGFDISFIFLSIVHYVFKMNQVFLIILFYYNFNIQQQKTHLSALYQLENIIINSP